MQEQERPNPRPLDLKGVVMEVLGPKCNERSGTLRVPLPLIVGSVDVLEPAVRSEDVSFAVAVDVGDADAVAVLLFVAYVMDFGLATGEGYPEDAGVVVVCENKIGVTVAVDVADGSTLGVVAVSDEVLLPESARWRGFTGVLVPPDTVGYPAGGNEVGEAVMVDVDGPFATVGDELAVYADGAELVCFQSPPCGPGFSYQ
jgi:hypothetical protein